MVRKPVHVKGMSNHMALFVYTVYAGLDQSKCSCVCDFPYVESAPIDGKSVVPRTIASKGTRIRRYDHDI